MKKPFNGSAKASDVIYKGSATLVVKLKRVHEFKIALHKIIGPTASRQIKLLKRFKCWMKMAKRPIVLSFTNFGSAEAAMMIDHKERSPHMKDDQLGQRKRKITTATSGHCPMAIAPMWQCSSEVHVEREVFEGDPASFRVPRPPVEWTTRPRAMTANDACSSAPLHTMISEVMAAIPDTVMKIQVRRDTTRVAASDLEPVSASVTGTRTSCPISRKASRIDHRPACVQRQGDDP